MSSYPPTPNKVADCIFISKTLYNVIMSLRNCRHGTQGVLDTASKSTLENEFGTSNDDECIMKILEKGNLQETEVRCQTFTCKEYQLTPTTDERTPGSKER